MEPLEYLCFCTFYKVYIRLSQKAIDINSFLEKQVNKVSASLGEWWGKQCQMGIVPPNVATWINRNAVEELSEELGEEVIEETTEEIAEHVGGKELQNQVGEDISKGTSNTIEGSLNSWKEFDDYAISIGKDNSLTDTEKITKLQEAFKNSAYKTDINVPSDAQYIKGFTADGKVIYDWPPKLGFDESTITSISRTDGLLDTWDRYGYMGGSNFADVPSSLKYTYSERAIPYVENKAAYHTGTFNNTTYFDEIDAIKSGDMDSFNHILKNEGIDAWELDE